MVLYSEKCKVRLDGKTAIVTGCNTGIGKETVRELYKRGTKATKKLGSVVENSSKNHFVANLTKQIRKYSAHVIMACRNTDKAQEAAKDIIDSGKDTPNVGRITIVELDLGDFKSIRDCCTKVLETEEPIDLLINNAGIMACPYGKTADGFEIQFGTNHLGHFLFTLLLLPRIIKSKSARIVIVSSMAHRGNIDFKDINWEKRNYASFDAYRNSKLANILFAKELNRRLKEAKIEGVNVYSLHPGGIATDLQRHIGSTYGKVREWAFDMARYFFKTPVEGAQTTIYCAIDESAGKESGLYYSDCKSTKPSCNAENVEIARKLWDVSTESVGLKDYDAFK